MRYILACAAMGLLAAPLSAREAGYSAIATGDLGRAEKILTAERRIYPNRPELMLNLAAVYGKTGRVDAARALYTQVLERPAASMLMPSGAAASSHDVAERGLREIAIGTIAAR